MRVRWRLAGSLLAALLAAVTASAHEARPAYLAIKEVAPGQFNLLWRTPVLAGMRLPVVLKAPEDIRNLREPLLQELADSLAERRWLDAGPSGLAGRRIEFVGLQLTITDVLVRVETLDGRTWTTIARPSQPWVEIAASQTRWEVTRTYVVEGIRHILLGADHVLCLLALLLVAADGRMLVKTLVAFSVAHSLTLAIATFGYAAPPAVPLNAAIALGILFLGTEILRTWRGETSFTVRHPWVVAYGLGLLHGFSFASGLSGTGLPRRDLAMALVSFNTGIEIGQLGVVLLVVLLAGALRRSRVRWPHWLQALPAYTVGTLGAFWTIQRTAILLGVMR